MITSEQIERIVSVIKSIGYVIWTAGFLFTAGFVGPEFFTQIDGFWNKVLRMLVAYVFWPLILGERLS